MAKYIDDAVDRLEKALKETKAEAARLEKALAALKNKGTTGRRGRPPGKTKTGRKRKQGGRRDQVLGLIKKHPGIRTAEIADALKMQPSAVSAQVSALNKEGLIKKDGRKLSAK